MSRRADLPSPSPGLQCSLATWIPRGKGQGDGGKNPIRSREAADVADDLIPYVQTLSRAGLPVKVEGVDVRVGAIMTAGRPVDSRPEGNLAGFR